MPHENLIPEYLFDVPLHTRPCRRLPQMPKCHARELRPVIEDPGLRANITIEQFLSFLRDDGYSGDLLPVNTLHEFAVEGQI